MHRRSSALSMTAVVRDRKFSTTPLQRQAELSQHNEERGVSRLRIDTRGSNAAESLENFSFSGRLPTSLSLARAETGGASPFAFHPGSRILSFPRASLSRIPEPIRRSYTKPFDEPSPQVAESRSRLAVEKNVSTGPVDVENTHQESQQSAADTRAGRASLRRFYNSARARRAGKPGGWHGIQFMPSLATAHANAGLLHEPPNLQERQALYVFDFNASMLPIPLFSRDTDLLQRRRGTSPACLSARVRHNS